MKLWLILLIALRAIRRNWLRSLLTTLGIIIGVASVIVLVSLGEGARAEVEAQVNRLGQNVVLVFPGSRQLGGVSIGGGTANTLTVEDGHAIRDEIPEVIAASPEVRSQRQVVFGNSNWFTRVYGQSHDYLQIRQWPIEYGRMFTENEVARAEQVGVLGQTVVDELFDGTNPIGETIRIHGLPITVIGVLQRRGMSLMGSVQDDLILVPYSTSFRKISGRSHAMVINVQVFSAEAMPIAQLKIADLLRERHRIGPDQEDDFTVQTQEEIAAAATETSRVMTLLLVSIASVSMLVGGIGIMNIMLVSVTERTREIGIRMAIGAHGKHILLQFLVESVFLSALGGLLGIATGAAATLFIAQLGELPVQLSETAIAGAFAIASIIGITFGFFPAWKASRLDPIQALRHE